MTNPAAFKATLVDFKNVRTRKLVQIVFEAPIEDADRILAGLGGYGTLGKESWWAVARMDGEPASEPWEFHSEPKKVKERRKWDELSYAEQAGIRCNEAAFRKWLYAETVSEAESAVRERCSVTTRTSILPGTDAARAWRDMETQYQIWLKAAEHVA